MRNAAWLTCAAFANLVAAQAFAQESRTPDPSEIPPEYQSDATAGDGAAARGPATNAAPTPENPISYVPPPRVYTTSRGGVDLQSGAYVWSNVDLSIGGPHLDGGISLVRDYSTGLIYPGIANSPLAFGNFDHSLDIRVWVERIPDSPDPGFWDWRAGVQIGTAIKAFVRSGGSTGTPFVAEGGWTDARLTDVDLEPYVYTDREGTVYTFRGTGPNPPDDCALYFCGYVANVVKLTGERLDFNYIAGPVRLRSVISNRGYAIVFEYDGTDKKPIKACAINLAVQYHNGTDACPAGARSVTYGYAATPGYTGSNFSFTDADGSVHPYSGEKFWKPGNTIPELSLILGTRTVGEANTFEVTRQDFADGDWITYQYLPFNNQPETNFTRQTAIVTDQTGTITATYAQSNYQYAAWVYFFFVSQGPISVVDQLGRTTINDFTVCTVPTCKLTDVKSVTMPEGNSEHYLYGVPQGIAERRQKPKPGTTPLPPDIVETAVWGSPTDPNWALRFKMLSHTDANHNMTSYAYDTTTALLIRVTGPAVPVVGTGSAIAPVRRFVYTQRYARVKDSGGSYAPVANPIWLLTEERTCKTTATVGNACSGGAGDEIVTTYDYGPNSGPNTLLLRGMVIDSGGLALRTCYGYDQWGNRISETAPRADPASCP